VPLTNADFTIYGPKEAIPRNCASNPEVCRFQEISDGETRNRTGDTTIFSRVLYQLSYLALGGRC
jgi:hypothetical protein